VGWHKLLLVFGLILATESIGEYFTHIGYIIVENTNLALLGHEVWGDFIYVFSYAVIRMALLLAVYFVFISRLRRVEARDMKWLWVSPCAYHVAYHSVWLALYELIFRQYDTSLSESAPIYHYIMLLMALVLVLIFVKIRLTLDNISKNIQLKSEAVLKDQMIDMQREHYKQLMQDAERTKTLHHDTRHHLAVIGGYNESGDSGKLAEYISGLTETMPVLDKVYCENSAVNIVAANYIAMAEREGVTVTATLVVPEDTGNVPVIDLCVIAGNLLNNAVEACRRMEEGDKFISVVSRVKSGSLSFVVENSFNGKSDMRNGVYYSMKDGAGVREGTGLSSVKNVCERHGGIVEFEAAGEVWKSSALVEMVD
jgi:sensor histidine kinase YesM